jgi:membrane dipeptidase
MLARARANMFAVRRKLKAEHPTEAEYQKAYDEWKRENPIAAGSIHDVLDHIEHVIRVAGIDHVGLGSDFDGVDLCPAQLTDVSMYPNITQGLLDRGYGESDIRKVLGENSLRVLREAEQAAQTLKRR